MAIEWLDSIERKIISGYKNALVQYPDSLIPEEISNGTMPFRSLDQAKYRSKELGM